MGGKEKATAGTVADDGNTDAGSLPPMAVGVNLVQRINAEHRACVNAAGEALSHAIEAGRLLAQVKALVSHGQWGDWLTNHFEGSDRTARLYMRCADHAETLLEAKRQHVADLTLGEAQRLLAAPKAKAATKTDNQKYLPSPGKTMMIVVDSDPSAWCAEIIPSVHDGYYYVNNYLDDGLIKGVEVHVEGSKKPIRGDYVHLMIDPRFKVPEAELFEGDKSIWPAPWDFNRALYQTHKQYIDAEILGVAS